MDNKKESPFIKEDKDKIVSVIGRTKLIITPKYIELSAKNITVGQTIGL